ncbi:MAG: hypothetical protein PF637_14880 [Spirochaetes bacterium]|nr:hypothetical protein [Spirochaetota bacterium]
MKEKITQKELLKMMRSGVRLKTPPPKTETPKNVYTRKTKHKRRFRNDSSFFCNKAEKNRWPQSDIFQRFFEPLREKLSISKNIFAVLKAKYLAFFRAFARKILLNTPSYNRIESSLPAQSLHSLYYKKETFLISLSAESRPCLCNKRVA